MEAQVSQLEPSFALCHSCKVLEYEYKRINGVMGYAFPNLEPKHPRVQPRLEQLEAYGHFSVLVPTI